MPLDCTLSERLPTQHEAEKAKEATSALARLTTKDGLSLPVRANGKGEAVIELPPAVVQMILGLLTHIAKGEAVTLIPFGAELTTQQAADILNVSRPFLIKLIESRQVPHHKVGMHRRIRAEDLLDYKKRRDADRNKALDELARLGQEIDQE
jgi:excisionase family DNA binding protein